VTIELFDTHAHLDDESFRGILPEVLQRADDDGVRHVLTIGICLATSQNAIAIARGNPRIRAVVGIQPNTCADCKSSDWADICELAQDPTVVALGETGLDRYWDRAPLELQQDYFDRHLRLSQETGLPFVVHMRDCQEDILVMLREARRRGPLRGVMHSFTGDKDGAVEAVELGLHISFAGMVTFKKSDDLRDVAAVVPDDRILIETDSPYLSPEPMRGKRPNEPARVLHTARRLAGVRGVPLQQFAAQTTENAKRLFFAKGERGV
jgi:TatD DNase family protein